MTVQELVASQDLDIAHYPGKWRAAKKLAEHNERKDDARLLPYWERVRLLYLELGGAFEAEKQKEIDRQRY